MRTFRRPNRLKAFGLVDSLVGLFLLVVVSGLLVSGFSTLLTLGKRQEAKAEALVQTIDTKAYESWF